MKKYQRLTAENCQITPSMIVLWPEGKGETEKEVVIRLDQEGKIHVSESYSANSLEMERQHDGYVTFQSCQK